MVLVAQHTHDLLLTHLQAGNIEVQSAGSCPSPIFISIPVIPAKETLRSVLHRSYLKKSSLATTAAVMVAAGNQRKTDDGTERITQSYASPKSEEKRCNHSEGTTDINLRSLTYAGIGRRLASLPFRDVRHLWGCDVCVSWYVCSQGWNTAAFFFCCRPTEWFGNFLPTRLTRSGLLHSPLLL